jgi:peptidoglycan/LPS O-acetylase OafA/YrhL
MHKNQLDKIRILAALVVIFSHHYPLTGNQAPAWLENKWLHWSVTGGVGVMVFFCISGYLVTTSWYREPKLLPFLWKRVLRLWPGMLGSVFFGVFFFGVIFNTIPLREYLELPTTWKFFGTNLTLIKHFPFLPGTFTTNPSSQVMNGVYWTIPMEFTCYLIVASLGLMGILQNIKLLKIILLIYVTVFLIYFNPDFTGRIQHWIEYPAFFAAGAFIALHKDWFSKYGKKLLIISTPILLATYFLTPYIATSRFLLLPPLVIFLGNLPAKENWFSKLGDPSYGIYLYGYPIAQSIMALWPDMNFWVSLTLTFALSICAGYASWLFIESRALRWKNAFSYDTRTDLNRRSRRNLLIHIPWAWVWPLLASFVGLAFITQHIGAPVPVDAQNIYLPMGRDLLEQGWTVLLKPESYHAAPLAYLWPALWFAEPTWIRVANMALWIGCVGFLWRTCNLLGGIRVGAIAMLLLLSPELLRYFPSEMTEPLYLFGLFGWMYAMARMIVNQDRSVAVVVQGACMLTITLLSRPVLQLIAPAILIMCLSVTTYWTIARKGTSAPYWVAPLPTIARSIGLGMLLPLAVIIKNGIFFDLWSISSGSGIGLYLGTHPLFQGAEPYFLGFDYDVNHLVGLFKIEDSVRSVAGDAAARQAAIWQIQSMSLQEAIVFFSHKLWWWLAQHPSEIDEVGSILRKLRLFELGTILTACVWLSWQWFRQSGPSLYIRQTIKPRQWVMLVFLSFMFLGMLGQLIPILYNSRYSTVLLDPWLIPLTAFGLALLVQPISLHGTFRKVQWSIGLTGREATQLWAPIAAIAAILVITFGGYDAIRKREAVAIDFAYMGMTETRAEITDVGRIEVQGLERKSDREWVLSTSPAALLVRIEASDVAQAATVGAFNAMWDTEIALHAQGQRCKVETAYQLTSGAIAQPDYRLPLTTPLRANGNMRHIVTHANNQLRPTEPGYLRLVIHCPTATKVEWRGTKLLESKHAWQASQHHSQ